MARQVDGQGVPTGNRRSAGRPLEAASAGPVNKDERRSLVPAAVFFVVQSGCLRQSSCSVGQPALHHHPRRRALPDRRRHLTKDRVLNLAGGENALDARHHPGIGLEIAVVVHRQLPTEEIGVREVSDVDEDPVSRRAFNGAGLEVAQADALDFPVADDLLDDGIPDEAHLIVGQRPALERLAGAQRVTAMDHPDLGGEARQEQPFLQGAVPPADDDDCFSRKKKPSQVAQNETPLPIIWSSPGTPRRRGDAAGGDDHRLASTWSRMS